MDDPDFPSGSSSSSSSAGDVISPVASLTYRYIAIKMWAREHCRGTPANLSAALPVVLPRVADIGMLYQAIIGVQIVEQADACFASKMQAHDLCASNFWSQERDRTGASGTRAHVLQAVVQTRKRLDQGQTALRELSNLTSCIAFFESLDWAQELVYVPERPSMHSRFSAWAQPTLTSAAAAPQIVSDALFEAWHQQQRHQEELHSIQLQISRAVQHCNNALTVMAYRSQVLDAYMTASPAPKAPAAASQWWCRPSISRMLTATATYSSDNAGTDLWYAAVNDGRLAKMWPVPVLHRLAAGQRAQVAATVESVLACRATWEAASHKCGGGGLSSSSTAGQAQAGGGTTVGHDNDGESTVSADDLSDCELSDEDAERH
jgi:hypothetical protein